LAQQIKPFIEEISLAFNPANRRQFILRKDMEETMFDKLIEMLKDQEVKFKEPELLAFCKEAKLSEEGQNAILAISKIVRATDKDIPDVVFGKLAKAIPELAKLAQVVEVPVAPDLEALKTLKETLTKEIEIELRKETDMGDTVIAVMKKDMEDLKTEKAQMQKDMQLIKDKALEIEIKSLVKDEGFVGDFDGNVKLLVGLKKADESLFDQTVESFKSSAKLMKAAGLFSEIGSGSHETKPEGKSASDKLIEIAKELRKDDPTLSEPESMKKAARANLDLYKEQTVKLRGEN